MTAILAAWGIAGNFRSDFLTPEQQARWVMRLLFPRWYWLVIGFLVITIIAILEGAYRTHAKKVKELNSSQQSEITEKDNAHKAEIERKEKEHQLDQEILHENHVKLELSLMNLREVEVEGLEKNFKLVLDANMEEMKRQQERHDTQVSKLVNKIREQSEQLGELTRHKLTFEVDTNEQSAVTISHFTQLNGFEESYGWRIRPQLKMRFINHDVHPVTVLGMKMSLVRHDEGGAENVISLNIFHLSVMQAINMNEIEFKTLLVNGADVTPHYWFWFFLNVSDEQVKDIDSSYCLRVTMEATRQPPYSVDLYADWKESRKASTPFFTPRK